MVVSVTSENSFDPQLVTSFEARVNGNRYAEIMFSYQSEQSVYLFSLLVGYHFDEKKHALQADNFRRRLTYAAYDLTSASVKDFHQSTVAHGNPIIVRCISHYDNYLLLLYANSYKYSNFKN